MKLYVTLAQDGRIVNYAVIGGIVGGTEITIPNDTDLTILDHASWDGERLAEVAQEPVPLPEPTIDQRIADLEAAYASLVFGGGTT